MSKQKRSVRKGKREKQNKEIERHMTGDKVFLDGCNIKMLWPSAKMEDKWFGPFEVLKKVGAAAYHLKIPRS